MKETTNKLRIPFGIFLSMVILIFGIVGGKEYGLPIWQSVIICFTSFYTLMIVLYIEELKE